MKRLTSYYVNGVRLRTDGSNSMNLFSMMT